VRGRAALHSPPPESRGIPNSDDITLKSSDPNLTAESAPTATAHQRSIKSFRAFSFSLPVSRLCHEVAAPSPPADAGVRNQHPTHHKQVVSFGAESAVAGLRFAPSRHENELCPQSLEQIRLSEEGRTYPCCSYLGKRFGGYGW
jgi:hypothetical protein